MRLATAFLGLWGLLAAPVHADPGDALGWLQRMVAAGRKLSYTGTFTYQAGSVSETSRITHLVDAAGEHEKVEVLAGSPREVLRDNDEVQCYLPDDKLVIVERRRQYKAFPALLPSSVGALGSYYLVRKGEVAHVAGFDSQQIILEPRDNLRYGQVLWAETGSGLLVKARVVNEMNEPIEQFAFTQLQIGGAIDRDALKSRFSVPGADWHVQNTRAEQSIGPGAWVFKSQLPGFRVSAGMKRQAGAAGAETTHFIFTDGLAAISVFIEPLGERRGRADQGSYTAGAINVYKRVAGNYLVTVLGEVPPATLKRLGDGIQPKRK